MKSLHSLTEAAKRLGVSRQWLWTLIMMGRIKAERIGNQYVIKEDDIVRGINKTGSIRQDA